MKNLNISNIINLILIYIYALYFFLLNKPYFVWNTYENGFFASIGGVSTTSLVGAFLIIVSLIYIYINNIIITKSQYTVVVMTTVLPLFTVVIAGGIKHFFSGEWLIYFIAILFLLLPINFKYRIYNLCLFIFAVTLVPSIFYYIVTKIGFSIPYEVLESYEPIKTMNHTYYKLYPFASQITNDYASVFLESRLSGIYDEAGRVGTLAGLFLISENYQLRKSWKNFIIFISGVLSFSLAFWALSFLEYIFSMIKKEKYKIVIYIIMLLNIYFIFINIDFNGVEILEKLQSRLTFTNGWLAGDNRTNEEFDALFMSLFSQNWTNILFGNGHGALGMLQANNIDGSSYKQLIYDYGFFGFFYFVILITVCVAPFFKRGNYKNNLQVTVILLAYLANIYQRPSIISLVDLVILYGGLINNSIKYKII